MGWDWLGKALGGLFGGGGNSGTSSLAQNAVNNTAGSKGFSGIVSGAGRSGLGSMGSGQSSGGGWGNAIGGLSKMFGGGQGLAGLGMMGAGALVPNAKAPGMPAEFTNYMNQLNQGGNPGMQSANQYYQGVLSGNNQGAYDAATSSLDDTYEQEKRKLISMYKTLRPGTDPSTDSTFKRDLSDLQGNYAKQRALAMAGVQQGAAQGIGALGSNISQMQGSAVQQYVDQIATQWGMNQSQRQALRESIMGLGGKMLTGPMDMQNMVKQMAMLKAMQ